MKHTKRCLKVTAWLLCLTLLLGTGAMAALPEQVEPLAREHFDAVDGGIQELGSGELEIWYRASTTLSATTIGAQSIVLYEADDGVNYFPVKTFYSSTNTGMMASGTSHEYSVYYDGTSGYYYQAQINFRLVTTAGIVGTYSFWTTEVQAL